MPRSNSKHFEADLEISDLFYICVSLLKIPSGGSDPTLTTNFNIWAHGWSAIILNFQGKIPDRVGSNNEFISFQSKIEFTPKMSVARSKSNSSAGVLLLRATGVSSTSPPGGNLIDGLPPAPVNLSATQGRTFWRELLHFLKWNEYVVAPDSIWDFSLKV